jgi:hypothetical protein
MTILDFTCLREGYTPAELRLPDSVLDGAGKKPLEGISERIVPPLYSAVFSGSTPYTERKSAYYRERYRKAKGATA